MPVEVKSQVNFLKGLNLATGKTTVVPGSVVRTSNMVYTKRGSLLTVDGTSMWCGQFATGGLSAIAADEVICIAAIPYGPLGQLPVALTSNFLFPGQRFGPILWDISTNPATYLGYVQPFINQIIGPIPPQVVNVNNYAVFLLGNSIVPTFRDFYNGTPPIGPPQSQVGGGTVLGAAHGVFHGGQLWLWNTYPFPNQNDGPSVLRACAFLASGEPDLTSFPLLSRAVIDANDGQQGMGCISFTSSEFGIAPTATLILFKDYATYQITGKFGDGSIAVTRAQTDMGCVAPRTIQFVPGFGVCRLTHFGVALFDGVKDTLISEEIRPYFFQSEPDISPVNWSAIMQSVACVSINPPMYIVAVPVIGQGTTNPIVPYRNLTRLFCYDLVLKAWTITDLPTTGNFSGIAYIATLRLPGTTPVTLMGDSPISGPQSATAIAVAGGSLPNLGHAYALKVTAVVNGIESGPADNMYVTINPPTTGQTILVTLNPPYVSDVWRVYVGTDSYGSENQYVEITTPGVHGVYISTLSGLISGTPPKTVGVRRWLNGDQTWDQLTPISWRTRMPDVFGKSPGSRIYYRRTVLRAKTSLSQVGGKFTISGVQQQVSTNRTFQPLVGESLYGSARYGYAHYGDAYPDLVLPFDVGVTGFSANAEYNGSGPIEILSNDWHFVPRPEGAPARVS